MVIDGVVNNHAEERKGALLWKLAQLTEACCSYLLVGLHAARQVNYDRERLKLAVFDESVQEELIRDEMYLAAQHVMADIRPAFEKTFKSYHDNITRSIRYALANTITSWKGNLSQQTEYYQKWIVEELQHELKPISNKGATLAQEFISRMEDV